MFCSQILAPWQHLIFEQNNYLPAGNIMFFCFVFFLPPKIISGQEDMSKENRLFYSGLKSSFANPYLR
jgi:hypothetical protein